MRRVFQKAIRNLNALRFQSGPGPFAPGNHPRVCLCSFRAAPTTGDLDDRPGRLRGGDRIPGQDLPGDAETQRAASATERPHGDGEPEVLCLQELHGDPRLPQPGKPPATRPVAAGAEEHPGSTSAASGAGVA